MRKKLFSIMLSLVMVLTFLPLGALQASAEEDLSYDAAVAYKSVIDKAYATYGAFRGYDAGEDMLTGLGLARLIDFDGNGTKELLIGCGTLNEDEDRLFYEVYGYENGLVKYAHQYCCDSFDLGVNLWLVQRGDENNFYTSTSAGTATTCDGSNFFSTLKNGRWEVTEFYSHEAGFCDGEYCGLADKDAYRINGKDVSETEFIRQLDLFGYGIYDIYDSKRSPCTLEADATEFTYSILNDVISQGPENNISVTIDGEKVTFDQPPVIINDRTMVPLRAIFEALGASVEWNAATRTVTSTMGNTTISMTIGSKTMYKNGEAISVDVAPQLVGDRTLVPARAVAESFNCSVDWDGATRTVAITTARERIFQTAKALYEVNEKQGGVTALAETAKVDAALYSAMNEIDATIARNDFVLDLVSAGTAATISAYNISSGNYSSINSLDDGINALLTSSEIADAADGVLKDAIKQRVKEAIGSSVPDINAFVLGLGRTAYDNNSKMILDLITVHAKFKANTATYEDAVAYILLFETLALNRKTMSMTVQVLCDDLPKNVWEALHMSSCAAAKATLETLFGFSFNGDGLKIGADLWTSIVSAYADYACGEGADFIKYMKRIDHPAITEWADAVDAYNKNLAEKLPVE